MLKRFNNDLVAFVDHVVSYNVRYERVEFTNLHKSLLEMGTLSNRDLKEGAQILKQISQNRSPKMMKSKRGDSVMLQP